MKLRAIKRVLFIAPALLLGVQAHAAHTHLLCEETWGMNHYSLNKEFDEHLASRAIKEFYVHQVSIDTVANTATYMGKDYVNERYVLGNRVFRKTPGYVTLIMRPSSINSDQKESFLFIIDRSTLRFVWSYMSERNWGEWWYERQGQCKTKRGPNASGRRIRQNHRFERLKI